MNNEIKKQYEKIFDVNGNVKSCGRTECIKLIELMQELNPNVDFGNIHTGFMNVSNINEYYRKIS